MISWAAVGVIASMAALMVILGWHSDRRLDQAVAAEAARWSAEVAALRAALKQEELRAAFGDRCRASFEYAVGRWHDRKELIRRARQVGWKDGMQSAMAEIDRDFDSVFEGSVPPVSGVIAKSEKQEAANG